MKGNIYDNRNGKENKMMDGKGEDVKKKVWQEMEADER